MKSTFSSPIVGVSSWALHQELGAPPIWGVAAGDAVPAFQAPRAALSLLELPEFLARNGFETMQICHFHLPSRAPDYLRELRAAIDDSGVSLHAFLVDDGDLTHPQNGTRDREWIEGWLPVAAQLGAQNVRVIAGKTVAADAIDRSAAALLALARVARSWELQILTENWFELLSTPDAVRQILARCEGEVGFLLDFGNWQGAARFADLAQVAPLAIATHAQATFTDNGSLNEGEMARLLALPYPPDFRGPFVLVNGGASGILTARDFIRTRGANSF